MILIFNCYVKIVFKDISFRLNSKNQWKVSCRMLAPICNWCQLYLYVMARISNPRLCKSVFIRVSIPQMAPICNWCHLYIYVMERISNPRQRAILLIRLNQVYLLFCGFYRHQLLFLKIREHQDDLPLKHHSYGIPLNC